MRLTPSIGMPKALCWVYLIVHIFSRSSRNVVTKIIQKMDALRGRPWYSECVPLRYSHSRRPRCQREYGIHYHKPEGGLTVYSVARSST